MGMADFIKNLVNVEELGQKVPAVGQKLSNYLLGTPTQTNNELLNYQNQLREQGYDENTINGVAQGLNSGNKEIANWIDTYNKGAGLNNPINIPQTEAQIGKARQGLFNKVLDEDPRIQRVGGAIPDLVNGFKENLNQGFNVKNLENNLLDNNRPKGLMYRAGEGLGTLTRFYDKPIGRGLLAGGLALAFGGGADDAVAQGLTASTIRQKNIASDQVYRRQLKQMGYSDEDLANIKGNITKDIFEGVTSGMKLGNQRMTYGQLALLDENIAKEVAQNPELANQFIPISLAKDIYGLKRNLATSKMEEIKIKADQNNEKIAQGWKRLQLLEAKGNLNEEEKAEYLKLKNELLRIQIANEGGTANKGSGAGRTRTQTTSTKKATSHRTNAF